MIDPRLPVPLDDWCRAQVGVYRIISTHDWPHGLSRVWQIEADGARYFVKNHRREGKWQRETWAYEQWVPQLAGETPRLVAVRETEPFALLLTALDGRCMEDVPLTDAARVAAWEAAGRMLARLHAIEGSWFGAMNRDGSPGEQVETDAARNWARRMDEWIARGVETGCLSADEERIARWHRERVDVLQGAVPVATHGDVSPRNWIVSNEGQWRGIIDFEQARWNLPAVDFMRWYDHEFLTNPELEAAVWRGYGREPSPAERARIAWMRLQGAITGTIWGREHGDLEFEVRNRAAIRRAWDTMQ